MNTIWRRVERALEPSAFRPPNHYSVFAARLLLVSIILITVGCRVQSGVDEPSEGEGPEVGIPLEVVQGAQGSVLAYVDVYFGDNGPHVFVLDTGASRSAIAPELVSELNLESSGETGEITGVAGSVQAELIEATGWRIGDTDLPDATIVSIDLPQISGASRLAELLGSDAPANMVGLLGSDVLSEFGEITIDYEEQVLRLRSNEVPASQ